VGIINLKNLAAKSEEEGKKAEPAITSSGETSEKEQQAHRVPGPILFQQTNREKRILQN